MHMGILFCRTYACTCNLYVCLYMYTYVYTHVCVCVCMLVTLKKQARYIIMLSRASYREPLPDDYEWELVGSSYTGP